MSGPSVLLLQTCFARDNWRTKARPPDTDVAPRKLEPLQPHETANAPTQNSALKDLCFGSVKIKGNFTTWQLLLRTAGKKGTASYSPCRIVSVPCNRHHKTEGHPDCHILSGERCPGKTPSPSLQSGERKAMFAENSE